MKEDYSSHQNGGEAAAPAERTSGHHSHGTAQSVKNYFDGNDTPACHANRLTAAASLHDEYLLEHLKRKVLNDAAVRDVHKHPVTDIKVVYQDNSRLLHRPECHPDFRVRKDGSVAVVHDPEKNNHSSIIIELERRPGDRGLPPVLQQHAVDKLVDDLAGRFMPQRHHHNGTWSRNGHIIDPQGLISERTKAHLHVRSLPEDHLPRHTREQIHRINRWHGCGGGAHGGGDGGRFTPQQASEQFPHRDVPRQPGEDDKLAAIKDVSAGFISHGDRHAYGAISRAAGRGFTVGRYGISSDQFLAWLTGLDDGDVDQLTKTAHLAKGAMALRRGEQTPDAAKVGDFLEKMKSGEGQITAGDMHEFFPKQLQERIGSDLVRQYAVDTADRDANGRPVSVNIGKTALSMLLGHAVSGEESHNAEYQSLMSAAEQGYLLALQHVMQPAREIDLSDAGKRIVAAARADYGQSLWRNHAAAVQWGNLGCAASVSTVLRDAGISRVDELSVQRLSSRLEREGWKAQPFKNRRPGDVIIASGPRHGHTGIVGETPDITYDNHSSSGRWSQDRAAYWLSNPHWTAVYVLRPPEG